MRFQLTIAGFQLNVAGFELLDLRFQLLVAPVKVRHGVVILLPLHEPQSPRVNGLNKALRLLELFGAELRTHALRLLHILGWLQQQVFLQAGERLHGSRLLMFAVAIVVPLHRVLQRLSFLPGPPIVAVLVHLEVSRVLALEVARKAVELDGGRHPVCDF